MIKRTLFFLLLSFTTFNLPAQWHLSIDSISGLPQNPPDTAFEAQSYNISITIHNDDSTTIQDQIDVFIKSASHSQADTLYSDTAAQVIPGNGSITVTRNNYVFSPVFFDDGDNIVVVWPSARTLPSTADTVTLNVYFVSLTAFTENLSPATPVVFPNPSTSYIMLGDRESNQLKQVRIYDSSGRLIYQKNSSEIIYTGSWTPGTYLLEIVGNDGLKRFTRVVKP